MSGELGSDPFSPRDVVFYDGGCGLCHAAVRFALRRDRDGSRFAFAPIGRAAWREAFPDAEQPPRDTVVVRTADGRSLLRSAAVLRLARRLSWPWALLAGLVWLVPAPLRDLAYRGVARVRRRLFAAPQGVCPAGSAEQRARFDLRA